MISYPSIYLILKGSLVAKASESLVHHSQLLTSIIFLNRHSQISVRVIEVTQMPFYLPFFSVLGRSYCTFWMLVVLLLREKSILKFHFGLLKFLNQKNPISSTIPPSIRHRVHQSVALNRMRDLTHRQKFFL